MKKAKWVSVLAVVCMLMALLPATAWADAAGTGGSTVESVVDAATWYGDQTTACDTLDSFWNDQVTEAPSTYVADDSARTVSLGDAAALVWWARLVNQGTSFAGYTVNLTADADLSAHYWTPICTGTVSYTAAGDCNIADSQTLEGVTFNGNGHTITGLTTQTGVRGAQQDSRPGDGQNSYSDAAFIGYNCCDLTLENLTFAGARIAISQPWEEITQIYGSSMLAVVVGRQNGGSLTLQNVAVRGASVLAMQKAAALVGDLAGNATLKVSQCEISDSRISAYFLAAPIVGYAKSDQVEVSGIRLARNTIHISEQDSSACALDPVTGAQYYGGALNASATALFYDGATDTGQGHELDLVAEAAGYACPDGRRAGCGKRPGQDRYGHPAEGCCRQRCRPVPGGRCPGCEPDHRFRRAHLHLYRSGRELRRRRKSGLPPGGEQHRDAAKRYGCRFAGGRGYYHPDCEFLQPDAAGPEPAGCRQHPVPAFRRFRRDGDESRQRGRYRQ